MDKLYFQSAVLKILHYFIQLVCIYLTFSYMGQFYLRKVSAVAGNHKVPVIIWLFMDWW